MPVEYDDFDPDSQPERYSYFDPEIEQGMVSADPYSSTLEVFPEIAEQGFGKKLSNKDESDTKAELRIDAEAYNELTKCDTNWATTFYHADVREERWTADYLKLDKESYFRMLGEINRGEKNGPKWENSEYHTHTLREDLVEIIGGMLNLNDLQLDEAKARATNVDGEKFGMRLELLVYCVCAYVVHNDDSTPYAKERKVHPNCGSKDVTFQQVAFELDLHPNRINRVYRRLEQKFSRKPEGVSHRGDRSVGEGVDLRPVKPRGIPSSRVTP